MGGPIGRRTVLRAAALAGIVPGALGEADARTQEFRQPDLSWPMHKRDARNRGNFGEQVFAVPLTEGWAHDPGGKPTAPILAGGHAFVGTNKGQVLARDALEGDHVWSGSVGEPIGTPPAADSSSVFVGTTAGGVHALSRADGERRWSYDAGSEVVTGLTVADGAVYLGTADRSVHAVDAESGAGIWTGNVPAKPVGAPAVADGVTYVGTKSGWMVAFEGGTARWRALAQGGIGGAPVVVDGQVVVAGTLRRLYAFSQADGEPSWEKDLNGIPVGGPVVHRNRLYVATDAGTIRTVTTGGNTYSYRRFDLDVAAPPLVSDEGIKVIEQGQWGGRVLTVTGDELEEVATFSSGGGAVSAVAARQNAMYFANGGRVTSLFEPDARDARRTLRELAARRDAAREAGVAVPQTSEFEREAVDRFEQGDYGAALDAADEGLAYVDRQESSHDEAVAAREQLADALAAARDDGLVVEAIADEDLAAVDRLVEDGEYDEAVTRAEEGRAKIAERREAAAEATEAIDALASAIDDCEASLERVELPGASDALETAREQYDGGDYGAAVETAREGREQAEQTCERAHDAREAIDEFEVAVGEAGEDLVVEEARASLQQARDRYDAGDYEAVVPAVEEGREQLDGTRTAAREARAAIEAAEETDAQQRGIHAVADVLDDDARLRTAREQYRAGEYGDARATAAAARRRSRLALFAVDGTAGAAVLGGILYKTDLAGAVRDRIDSLREDDG